MSMPTPLVEKILILQDRDKHRRDLEGQLQSIPREVAATEAKIASEKAAIEAARLEFKELEAKKKVIDTEIGATEQKIAKYRSQQLEVKKNDEYRAIGQEIENFEKHVGTLEEQEIGILYAIDEAKKKFAAAEATLKQNISIHESRIKVLRERETQVKGELKQSQDAFTAARAPLDEVSLRLYDRISSRSFPACVPVRSAKCGGCHLKISAEAEAGCRSKEPKLAVCDQCGRIIWWES